MTDDTPRIVRALNAVDGLTVTAAWPTEPPSAPVVLVTLAGQSAADRRDDVWYLTEMNYYVRVFAPRRDALMRACDAADAAMRALGYEPVFRWDEPGEGWRQIATRYRAYL